MRSARAAIAAGIQLDSVRGVAIDRSAGSACRRGESAGHVQVLAHGERDLAAEDVASQLRGQGLRLGIRQQQPERLFVEFEQREQRDQAPLGRQPAVPLPLPGRQAGDIVHALRLREYSRIAAGKRQYAVAGQRLEGVPGRLRVVGHGVGT
jgi:hypothetical protein